MAGLGGGGVVREQRKSLRDRILADEATSASDLGSDTDGGGGLRKRPGMSMPKLRVDGLSDESEPTSPNEVKSPGSQVIYTT